MELIIQKNREGKDCIILKKCELEQIILSVVNQMKIDLNTENKKKATKVLNFIEEIEKIKTTQRAFDQKKINNNQINIKKLLKSF